VRELTVALCAAALAACSDGEKANNGLAEPLQVSGGQFISGALPGTPAPEGGLVNGGDAGMAPLSIVQINSNGTNVLSGVPQSLSGLVSGGAAAVGVRFADMGTGYWVVNTSGFDVNAPGQRDFSLNMAFSPDIPQGSHPLEFVAVANDGTAGTQASLVFCFDSRVPDNGHTCNPTDPKHVSPAVVFSLRWDTGFDLDLHVLTPDGQDVNPKNGWFIGDAGVTNTTPRINRDSWGNCAPDGWHEEDLVFQTPPAPGNYYLYANPFAACGQSAARFTMTIYQVGPDGYLHSKFSQAGELLSSQVVGGPPGLFVTQISY
jgi:hypothetical protein